MFPAGLTREDPTVCCIQEAHLEQNGSGRQEIHGKDWRWPSLGQLSTAGRSLVANRAECPWAVPHVTCPSLATQLHPGEGCHSEVGSVPGINCL